MNNKDTIRAAAAAAYFIAGECYERAFSVKFGEDPQYQGSWFNQYAGALRVAMLLEKQLA